MNTAIRYNGAKSKFVGYEQLSYDGKVIVWYVDNGSGAEDQAGQAAIVVLDVTPFYAESAVSVAMLVYCKRRMV